MSELLASFLLVSLFITFWLARNKMHVAKFAYFVMIISLSFVLLASNEQGVFANFLVGAFGKTFYIRLIDGIYGTEALGISPIVIIQLLIPLLCFITCVALTIKTVEVVSEKLREVKEIVVKNKFVKLVIRYVNNIVQKTRIYLTNCVMRC